MIAKCIVCGKEFIKSPSDNIVTCSSECSRKRRSEVLQGHSVSVVTRNKISTAAKKRGSTDNLKKGTPAAMNSPKAGRFDTNSSAKSWVLVAPDGQTFECTNLNNWIRKHIEMFDCDLTDENVARISAGFRTIKRNIKTNRSGQTYKGWTLKNWDDTKNVDKE